MAETANITQVHELIKNRWSPRAFSSESVNEEDLLSMYEAARLAPSNYNLQPWRFIYATREDKEAYEKMLGVLWEFNQEWAAQAPVLHIAIAEVINPVTGTRNAHAWHDIGLAMENFTLQGESLGIKVHQMAGFDAQIAREVYQIPENFEPVSAAAIGYPGNPEQLPDKFQEHEKNGSDRISREQIVFKGTW